MLFQLCRMTADNNLIVGDFHTYFIGEKPLMVHDGLLRQSTAVVLPGYHTVVG